MRKLSRDLAHALAAEYVVGTLRGRARARFEAIARGDREVAAILRSWEEAITPLAEHVAPIEPPARVWRNIESRIAPATAGRTGFWASVRMWQSLAAAMALLLIVTLATLGPRESRDTEPMMVAVLSASDAAPRAVVSLYAPDVMRVRIVKPWGNMDNQSLELWAIPHQGAPRSLGLVANASDRETLMKMPMGSLRDVKALAVTMEPMGGSPTKQPTASPVCSGPIAAMRRA